MTEPRARARKADHAAGPIHMQLGDLDRLPGFEPPRVVTLMTHRSPPGGILRWFVGVTAAGDILTLEEPAEFLAPWQLVIRRRIKAEGQK